MVGISPRQQIFLARSSFPRIFAPVPLLSETQSASAVTRLEGPRWFCRCVRAEVLARWWDVWSRLSRRWSPWTARLCATGAMSFDPQILDEADGRNSQG